MKRSFENEDSVDDASPDKKRLKQDNSKECQKTKENQNENELSSNPIQIRLNHEQCKRQLRKALSRIEKAGEITVSGIANQYLPDCPGLTVNDFGNIPLPLCDEQAKELLSKCKKAGYGHGTELKQNDNVRNTYELDANDFTFKNPQWDRGISKLIKEKIASGLGICKENVNSISFEKYKLLIYDKNGHFLEHRDTEKKLGMFATLIVQLPSQYTVENNEAPLIVKYKEKEYKHYFGTNTKNENSSEYHCYYSSFYCDLKHKVSSVASGYRMVVAYNLYWNENSFQGRLVKVPSVADLDEKITNVYNVLNGWNDTKAIGLKLEHLYTEREISDKGIYCFKGMDLERVTSMIKASNLLEKGNGIRVCIGQLIRTKSESMDGYGDCDEDDITVGKNWFDENGNLSNFGKYLDLSLTNNVIKVSDTPYEQNEDDDDDEYEDDEDDEDDEDNDSDEWETVNVDEEDEYMGNYPGTRTTTYHRNILIFWKTKYEFELLCSKGGVKAGLESIDARLNSKTFDASERKDLKKKLTYMVSIFDVTKDLSCTVRLLTILVKKLKYYKLAWKLIDSKLCNVSNCVGLKIKNDSGYYGYGGYGYGSWNRAANTNDENEMRNLVKLIVSLVLHSGWPSSDDDSNENNSNEKENNNTNNESNDSNDKTKSMSKQLEPLTHLCKNTFFKLLECILNVQKVTNIEDYCKLVTNLTIRVESLEAKNDEKENYGKMNNCAGDVSQKLTDCLYTRYKFNSICNIDGASDKIIFLIIRHLCKKETRIEKQQSMLNTIKNCVLNHQPPQNRTALLTMLCSFQFDGKSNTKSNENENEKDNDNNSNENKASNDNGDNEKVSKVDLMIDEMILKMFELEANVSPSKLSGCIKIMHQIYGTDKSKYNDSVFDVYIKPKIDAMIELFDSNKHESDTLNLLELLKTFKCDVLMGKFIEEKICNSVGLAKEKLIIQEQQPSYHNYSWQRRSQPNATVKLIHQQSKMIDFLVNLIDNETWKEPLKGCILKLTKTITKPNKQNISDYCIFARKMFEKQRKNEKDASGNDKSKNDRNSSMNGFGYEITHALSEAIGIKYGMIAPSSEKEQKNDSNNNDEEDQDSDIEIISMSDGGKLFSQLKTTDLIEILKHLIIYEIDFGLKEKLLNEFGNLYCNFVKMERQESVVRTLIQLQNNDQQMAGILFVNPCVQRIFKQRLHYLNSIVQQGTPRFTWIMQHVYEKNKNCDSELRTFLMSEKEAFHTAKGKFTGIARARDWARQQGNIFSGYLTFIPNGTGRNSTVRVNKTRQHYDEIKAIFDKYANECAIIRSLVGNT